MVLLNSSTLSWLSAIYIGVSLICFAVYAMDKSAARRGARRVPERTLHLLAVAGGWPGALMAQRWLRHKSSKQSFQWKFRGTVVLNLALLIAVGVAPL